MVLKYNIPINWSVVVMGGQEVINAIGSVGFPIVACCGLFYLYDKTIKEIVNALDNVTTTLDNVNKTLGHINEELEKDK